MRYIIAIDEGTTSVRAVLFDIKSNNIIRSAQLPITQYYPYPGWVEQNPEEIWQNTYECLKEIMNNINPQDVFGIGITNQRETTVAWDKRTGKSASRAIVWQCRRTADVCNKIRHSRLSKVIKLKTGLLVDAYFSATKIQWLLQNSKRVQQLKKNNNLCVGTIDSFLVYRLTEGRNFITDVTNASRTMLFNIHELKWDDLLLKEFKIPREILPRVVDNTDIIGYTSLLGGEIPIAGIAGDQQSSLFGQGCFRKGDIKCTYGTGAFVLMNLGDQPTISNQLLTTIGYKINGKLCYALEGSIYNCGSAIDWACSLKLALNPVELTHKATRVQDNGGVVFVPALTGLGCPHWDMDARALVCGMNRGTTSSHIARAVLESIPLSVYDVINQIKKDKKIATKTLSIDGGVTQNHFIGKLQANLLKHDLIIAPKESTTLGVIYLCGLATGAYDNIKDIENRIDRTKLITYDPSSKKDCEKLIAQWQDAVKRCLK